MFDIQRSAIEQGQRLFTQGFMAQDTADKLARTGLKSQEALQCQQLEIAEATAHGTVNAMAAMIPGDQQAAHRGLEETFDQLKAAHEEFYDVVERELKRDVESADELSTEFENAMQTGTEQVLETSRTAEDQTVETVEAVSGQFRDQLERMQEIHEQFEDRTGGVEALLERQAEQMDSLQQQLEEQAAQLHEQVQEQDQEELNIQLDVEHALEAIDGIGETTRERLVDAGISTVDDLTASDPETVAEAAEVSPSRARDWIDQAEA
jgi:predicted flap endonuclease-1-like 5' DNA nuclease